MKTLYATMQFGRGYSQGTERYVAMLTEGLRQRGHEAVVVAGDPSRRGPQMALGDLIQEDPRTLYCPTRGWMSVVGLPAEEWAPLLEQERPDLVHLVNPAHVGVGLATAARRAGIPVAVTVMDYWWLCPKHTLLHHRKGCCDGRVTWQECLRCIAADDERRWLRGLAEVSGLRDVALPTLYFGRNLMRGVPPHEIRNWVRRQEILRAVLNEADAVVFPSRGTHTNFRPHVNGIRAYPVAYGLESRWFEARRESRPNGHPREPDELKLGFAGAVAHHKGLHLVLEALRQLDWRSTKVLVAGACDNEFYEHQVRNLARGLNVDFVGCVSSERMPDFMRELDLLVLPSIWPENLPIVMLEAQAIGVPVLASRIDGVTEAIADPGMLFDVNSPASLAKTLKAWVQKPRIPLPAQPVSTADQMVEQTLGVYQGIHAGA